MSDRKGAAANIVAGAVFTIAGTLLELHAFGAVFADQPSAHPWLVAIAGLLGIVPGICFVVLGLRTASRSATQAKSNDEVLVGCIVSLASVTLMAILLTAVAVFAWQTDPSGRFSGGITGSIWEHRIIWSLAAGAFDAAALLAWYALAVAWMRPTGRGD